MVLLLLESFNTLIYFYLIFFGNINQKIVFFLFNLLFNFAKLFFDFFLYLCLGTCIFLFVNLFYLPDFVLVFFVQSFFHIFDFQVDTLPNISFHILYFLLIRGCRPFDIFDIFAMRFFICWHKLLNFLSSFMFTLINLLFVFLSHFFTILCKHLLNFHILLFKLFCFLSS